MVQLAERENSRRCRVHLAVTERWITSGTRVQLGRRAGGTGVKLAACENSRLVAVRENSRRCRSLASSRRRTSGSTDVQLAVREDSG